MHWFLNCTVLKTWNWSASQIDTRHAVEHFGYVLPQTGVIILRFVISYEGEQCLGIWKRRSNAH